MADQNLTELTELTTLTSEDLLHVMDDPAGSPVDKKVTLTNLFKSITALTAESTLANNDVIAFVDDPAGTPVARKVTLGDLGDFVADTSRRRYIAFEIFSMRDSETCATGDGKGWAHIPADFNAMNLVEVHAELRTAGTTGTMSIQIHNATDTVDMLSTKITLDTGETGSDTAATAAVIDTANDDVATNDVIRVDVDGVHTTPGAGCIVTLGFE